MTSLHTSNCPGYYLPLSLLTPLLISFFFFIGPPAPPPPLLPLRSIRTSRATTSSYRSFLTTTTTSYRSFLTKSSSYRSFLTTAGLATSSRTSHTSSLRLPAALAGRPAGSSGSVAPLYLSSATVSCSSFFSASSVIRPGSAPGTPPPPPAGWLVAITAVPTKEGSLLLPRTLIQDKRETHTHTHQKTEYAQES